MSGGARHEPGNVVTAQCCGCGKQVRAPAAQAGKRVRCPHCEDVVTLPGGTPRGDATVAAVPDDRLLVSCPSCAAQFYARQEHAGRPTKCGKCGAMFAIPRLEMAAAAAIEPDAFSISPFDLDDETEGYSISTPAARAVVAIDFPEEPRAIAERIELDAAPRSLFFSGVFDFPFRGDAASRWLSLTLLMTLLSGLIVAAALYITGGADSAGFMQIGFGVVGAGGFLLAALGTFFIAAGFGSSCAKAIIEDTAAGSAEVESWPDADWRNWVIAWLPFLYVLFLCLTIGFGVRAALLLVPGNVDWVVNLTSFLGLPFLLYPFLMLSGMEGGSMLVPVSGPVLGSLFRQAASWLVFYALVALLVLAVVLPTLALGRHVSSVLAVLYFAPLASTGVFVYSRLLGRLAWRISQPHGIADDDEENSSDEIE